LYVEDLKRGTNKDIGSKDIFEMGSIMIVTSIQLAMTDPPKEKNVAHALSLINQAPPSDLILLTL